MSEYDIKEVLEYANDLRKEFQNRDDVEEFNQAIMRLTNAVQELHVVDSFSEIKEK